MQCFWIVSFVSWSSKRHTTFKELEVLAYSSVRFGKHLLFWVLQKDLLPLTGHPVSWLHVYVYARRFGHRWNLARYKSKTAWSFRKFVWKGRTFRWIATVYFYCSCWVATVVSSIFTVAPCILKNHLVSHTNECTSISCINLKLV